jgi:hypothetical protein
MMPSKANMTPAISNQVNGEDSQVSAGMKHLCVQRFRQGTCPRMIAVDRRMNPVADAALADADAPRKPHNMPRGQTDIPAEISG